MITDAAIRDLRKERKLSDEHIREVFSNLGFMVKSFEGIDVAGLFPKQIKKTDEFLFALSKTTDPNPNGADTSLITDLYSFAAYLMEEPESSVVYRGKSTSELLSIFDTFSKKFSQRNDNLGKLCASIATAGKTYIFNSDENRNKYEFHLKYKTRDLSSLFDSMRGAPKQVLIESSFAEPCIKRIAETLDCTYEIALAVYNKEGNITYSPKVSAYLVKCQFCGTMNQYPSEQDAIKANACSNCKKTLFKKCTKCGRMVLASLDKCPYTDCGFVFASAAMFSKVSTLDIETAYEIEKMALDFKDKTVVFISHNFSGKLIRNYDDILVVQNGSLLTHGTYNELINSCDYFRRICEIKFGDIR